MGTDRERRSDEDFSTSRLDEGRVFVAVAEDAVFEDCGDSFEISMSSIAKGCRYCTSGMAYDLGSVLLTACSNPASAVDFPFCAMVAALSVCAFCGAMRAPAPVMLAGMGTSAIGPLPWYISQRTSWPSISIGL